jgi:hypothetical protein
MYVGSGLSKTLGFQKGEKDKCNEIETRRYELTLTAFRFLQIQDPVIKLGRNFRCLESLEMYIPFFTYSALLIPSLILSPSVRPALDAKA